MPDEDELNQKRETLGASHGSYKMFLADCALTKRAITAFHGDVAHTPAEAFEQALRMHVVRVAGEGSDEGYVVDRTVYLNGWQRAKDELLATGEFCWAHGDPWEHAQYLIWKNCGTVIYFHKGAYIGEVTRYLHPLGSLGGSCFPGHL